MTEQKKTPPKGPAKPAKKKAEAKAAEKAAPKEDAKAKPEAEPKVDEAAVEIDMLQEKVKDLNDKLLRAMAEMENTRRRAEREAQDARAYAITNFAREMLTVQDNLGRAIKHLPEDIKENEAHKAFIEGVEVTERELLNIFDRQGIKKVAPKGEAFDHNLHQAMFEAESPDHEPGTVIEVIQEGYVIRDRLLRPALVGVSKAPAADAKKDTESDQD